MTTQRDGRGHAVQARYDFVKIEEKILTVSISGLLSIYIIMYKTNCLLRRPKVPVLGCQAFLIALQFAGTVLILVISVKNHNLVGY